MPIPITKQASHDPNEVFESASPSNPDVLRSLYAKMLTYRLARQRIAALRSGTGLHWTVEGSAPSESEAVLVGATFELRPDDTLALLRSSPAAYLLKGMSIGDLVTHVAKSLRFPSNDLFQLNLLRPADSAEASLNQAAGLALAYRQMSRKNVVVALCGDGVAALGAWHSAAQLAADRRLPIVFVVETDLRHRGSSQHWFGALDGLSHRAHDYGFPGISVDGKDVVAVFRVTQESIHRARSGAGPTLVECKFSSSTSKHAASRNGSVSKGTQMHPDPIAYMEHYLRKREAWSDSWKQQLLKNISAEIEEAVSAAQSSRNR